jgi:hypothetical protein
VPEERAPLRGSAQVNQDLVRELARRCAGEKIAAIDLDATVIESWKREAKNTFAVLPETVRERYFRRDSACDEEALLSWLRNEQRPEGPQGFIGFAVSARMNPVLRGPTLNFPTAYGVLGFLRPVLYSVVPVAPRAPALRTPCAGFRARVY